MLLIHSRRAAALIVFAAFIITLFFLRLTTNRAILREKLTQAVGLGEFYSHNDERPDPIGSLDAPTNSTIANPQAIPLDPVLGTGPPRPIGYEYSRVLVIPRMRVENVDWVHEELPDLETAIYVADDSSAPLHPPQNKGHEVMIYFTYIIDHYDTLPDIAIFMHSHRHAWHNNELFGFDAAEMIRRLSSDRVWREGYMNLRCHWNPGCPSWMHPGSIDENWYRPEEPVVARSWSEIFPNDPIPVVLGQACCSQFALSRERILSIPKSQYTFYRDWLLRTDLDDAISGRVWEYLWQYLWTSNATYCPTQSSCYCDGYGLCFGGEDQFEEFYQLRVKKESLETALSTWRRKAEKIAEAKKEGKLDEAHLLEVPELNKDLELQGNIDHLQQDLDFRRDQALIRGQDPRERAKESNRTWHDGDGF